MDPAAARAEMANRQRAWMAQRQAEHDRKSAQASVGRAAGSSVGSSEAASSGGPAVNGAEVLDQLAVQIAERLQVEVRKENAKLLQDGEVGARVEQMIERHIGSNTCPICFELMAGKERQPTLLFPCGHTFCATCLHMHLDKLERKTCPYCREKVTSHAPNISLQQVIDGFVERQQSLARGEVLSEVEQSLERAPTSQQHAPSHAGFGVGGAGGGGARSAAAAVGGEAAQYAAQYRTYSMRCRVMRNQLLDARAELAALQDKSLTAHKVLDHLAQEEHAAEQRLEAARLELEVVQSQRAEQAAKCEQVAARRRELEQMDELVGQTFSSLEAERQKALLLVRNFAPDLADELQADFEEEEGFA